MTKAMKMPQNMEVKADGSILFNGQLVGRTNNPDEVRRRLFRKRS